MPEAFPFHKNWKSDDAYWQLLPTIDHVVPASRGGTDDESNWVCTSQLKNSAKSNWLLEELNWVLHKPDNIREWDGMLSWFIQYVEKNSDILEDKYIKSWYNAAKKYQG